MYNGFPYDPFGPYGVMDYYNPNEKPEDQENRSFTSLIIVIICYIGFPIAMAIGYGLYELVKWFHNVPLWWPNMVTIFKLRIIK